MENHVIERDNVVVEDKVYKIYKTLAEGNNIHSVPFRTMKDVFMWAVCLGVRQGKRRPLTSKKITTIFRWTQFDAQIDIPLLKAIAIVESGDINILLHRTDILNIAEEYANGGIYILRESLLTESSQPLWNLVDILSPQSEKQKTMEGG
jgi:dnd system-associated protein 4